MQSESDRHCTRAASHAPLTQTARKLDSGSGTAHAEGGQSRGVAQSIAAHRPSLRFSSFALIA